MAPAKLTSTDPRFVAVVLVVGIFIRCLWQIDISGGLSEFAGAGEATRVAMALAEGRGFADAFFEGAGPTAHLLPINPLLAGAIMALFGVDTPPSNVALLALSLAQVLFAYAMLVRLFDRLGADPVAVRWSLLAICLVPVFVQREVIDFRYWEGALALGLVAASFAMLANQNPAHPMTLKVEIKASLLCALTFFVSPPCGLAVVACWAIFSLRTQTLSESMKSAAIVVAAFAMFLGPWTVRNQLALGSPIVLRSNAGLELALANHDGALADRPTIEKFADRIVAIHPYHGESARRAMAAAGGEVAYARGLGEQTRAWIATHPADFLRLSAGHIRQLYFPEFWAYVFNESDAFNVPRSMIIALVNALGLVSLAVGLALRRRGYWMIGLYILSITLTYAIVQPITRYTYLVSIPLLFVAIDGLVRAARAVGRVLTFGFDVSAVRPVLAGPNKRGA